MDCDRGALVAYRDRELPDGDQLRIAEHLATCAECREALHALEARSASLRRHFDELQPPLRLVPEAGAAWSRLARVVGIFDGVADSTDSLEGSRGMNRTALMSARWRFALAGLAAVLAVAVLIGFGPARRAAADFLSVFRVKSITVVPITSDRAEQLDELGRALDGGLLGEPVVLREPSAPTPVADVGEASSAAGFPVLSIDGLAEDVQLTDMSVAEGPQLRFEIDRATAQLALAAAGLSDVVLPPVDTFTIEVDVPKGVEQSYIVDGQALQVLQMPSPSVTLPPGVPADRLGRALLQVLGFSAEDAERLAADIDWTSTLVIPLPTDIGNYEEVTVGGAPAVVLWEAHRQGRANAAAVIWQRDGVLYAVTTTDGVATSLLVRAAEALR